MAVTFDVYFGPTGDMELVSEGQSELTWTIPYLLDYNTEYSWRIDSTTDLGTTEGDVWTFTVVDLAALAPYDIVTYKKLVACANNTFWYET
jgi:hypothetical protein